MKLTFPMFSKEDSNKQKIYGLMKLGPRIILKLFVNLREF